MSSSTRCSPELRERAVRMVFDRREDNKSEWATVLAISKLLDMSPETLRGWVRRSRVDQGTRGSHDRRACSHEATRTRESRPAAHERNPAGRVDFLRDCARRSNQEVVAYIDSRRDRWGVEPIFTALEFAPSTYYATKDRPSSARTVRDEALKLEIQRVYDSSLDGCYGAKKVWKQLNRESIEVANCTVCRLMT